MKTDNSNGILNTEYCKLKYNKDILQVSSYNKSKTQTINRKDIGSVSSEFITQLPYDVVSYAFRFFIGGFILIIVAIIISVIGYDLFGDIVTVISFIAFGVSIFLWSVTILDAMIGSRIGFKLLSPIFGVEGNRIIVKNTNSINTLHFFVGKGQVKMLERFIDESKLEPSDIVNNSRNNQSTSLDELEKLAILRDKGVITEDEFNAKKKSILEL